MTATITTARGTTAVVLSLFQRLFPDETIRSEVLDAVDTHQVLVPRRISNRSLACDPCECAVSRAVKAALEHVLEVFTLKHVSYFLERVADGTLQVTKYQHDGAYIVSTVDAGENLPMDGFVTLGPPCPSRRVGRQSTSWKDRDERERRGPQTPEHIEKRRLALAEGSSIRRIQNAACMVAN